VARWIQLALRRLRHSPGFTLAAFLTLAVGFGSAMTVFSIVDAVLLRPLPYPESGRLVSPSHTLQVRGELHFDQSDASILFYGRHNQAFAQFGGYEAGTAAVSGADGSDAERVAAARVTAGVLSALRVSPASGRLFVARDDERGAPPVAIVAERLLTRKFGAGSALTPRRIMIDGQARELVGILPDSVRFPASGTELWLPLTLDPAKTDSASFDYKAVARLRDGVTIEQAEADLQRLLPQLPREFPGRLTRDAIDQTHMRASVRPLASVVVDGVATLLWVVLGAALFVLAAGCVNVACLFLVRAEGRRKTFAIQRLLGAGRDAVLLEFLGEAVLVTALGGLCGAAAAIAATRAVRLAVAIDIPRLTEVRVDGVVLGIVGLSVATIALVIAAFTSWRSRTFPSSGLAALGAALTVDHAQQRARYALVALQVALAMVLVVGSGLMARSLWQLRQVQPGFDRQGALTFRLALPPPSYPSPDDAVRFVGRAVDEISRLPGVQSAAAASRLPLEDRDEIETAVFDEGNPRPPGTLPRLHPVAYVTRAYFATMAIPIVEGDTFRAVEPPATVLETVVSRSFAEQYWPRESAIGKYIRILVNGPLYRVVGVAADVRNAGLDRPADQIIYCPLLPPRADPRWTPRDLAFVVRTSGEPTVLAHAIRGTLRRLDSSLPLYHAGALSDLVTRASARRQLVLALLAAACAMALLLGMIGLYGVVAYAVSLRTREIGIRIALGEQPSSVGFAIARQGVSVAVLGVAAGAAGAIGLARVLGTLLFDVAPSDPLVLMLSAAFVLALATLASWFPGRRAAAVDPAIALRVE
jgi:putative ABC transport system permease protein